MAINTTQPIAPEQVATESVATEQVATAPRSILGVKVRLALIAAGLLVVGFFALAFVAVAFVLFGLVALARFVFASNKPTASANSSAPFASYTASANSPTNRSASTNPSNSSSSSASSPSSGKVTRTLWVAVLLASTPLVATPLANAGAGQELTNELALDQIEELSPANKALFVSDNLASITEPTKLTYSFKGRGRGNKLFTDQVEVNINRIKEGGRRDLTFRFLKGRNKVRFSPQYAIRSNPIFMLFLERDARMMQTLTGGNALFFRNRIRHALARADTKKVRFEVNGEQVSGLEIKIQPFMDSTLSERFPKYEKKTYSILLSDKVAGAIYQIRAFVPELTDTEEVMVFNSARPI